MLTSLFLSFSIVFPLFVLLALGFLLRQTKIFDENTVNKLNSSVFKIFLPTSVCINVYHSKINDIFDAKLISYAAGSVILSFIILFIIIPLIVKEPCRRGVLIQGIFRSNFLILGLPLAQNLYADGSIDGAASILIAIIVPIFNVLAVVALEVFRSGSPSYKKILKGIVTNPLIIGSSLGFLLLLSSIKLPSLLDNTISEIAQIATPLALIALGASLNFKSIRGNITPIIWGILGKLVIVPAVFLTIAILLGFRNRELAILLSLFASPTAVSSYTMAHQMGCDYELAGQLVVFGTSLAILTLFLWIFLLTYLGYIVPII
ncbi:MAG: AEC family transporter [Bacillota bacterium]|nr:AEC family transporter [Bacillota bacterium]